MIPLERTHEYRGRYHVLGGALSPIDGVDPDDLRIAELYRARRGADSEIREVVLATNPTTTGEATALHIADGLRERARGDRLQAAVNELVVKISAQSGAVLGMAKKAVLAGMGMSLRDSLRNSMSIFLNELYRLEDSQEGLRALLEKRKPQWKNR